MKAESLALALVRGGCFLLAGFFLLWPLVTGGRIQIAAAVIALPFLLAGLAPRRFGPAIGKGLMVIATLYAFYDPPSSISFHAQKFAEMTPIFLLALMLAVPQLPQALTSVLVKE